MRGVATVLFLLAPVALAQVPVASDELVRFRAYFEPRAGEPPLLCDITPDPPSPNYAFRFRAGYTFHVPESQYSGTTQGWSVFTSIHSDGNPIEDKSFVQDIPLTGAIKVDSNFDIRGGYFLGVGRYSVESVLRDDRNRVCRKQWRIVVPSSRADRSIPSALPPHAIRPYSPISLPDLRRHDSGAPMRLSVLVNAAAFSTQRTIIQASDRNGILGALTALLEHLPTKSVRVVVFSLEQQREVVRIDDFSSLGLRKIAGAIAVLPQSTVDAGVLQTTLGYVDTLGAVIRRELEAPDRADTVIFLGPTSRYSDTGPKGELPIAGESPTRFFYVRYEGLGLPSIGDPLNTDYPKTRYQLAPGQISAAPPAKPSDPSNGQADIIAKAVTRLNGKTLIIHSPAELAAAIRKIENLLADVRP